ncbi:hypothetical protein JB92DRAFT_2918739 [Gautieria morchelliformis]|nr:hypothetical protein JB92DRAFT_2918739 [Gautieria morchelliformis]
MTTAASCTIPANPSPELQVALNWIEGYNRWDIDLLFSTVSDDYTHHVLPGSLGIKPRSKEEFREYLTSIFPMFQGFTVTLHEIVEAPGKILFHVRHDTEST